MTVDLDRLDVKVFADGADKDGILKLAENPLVQGFTTNPTLMRKAGIDDYEAFARDILAAVPDRPFSLEVFSDDFAEMEEQALKIASWGQHVYVKIPVSNTSGEPSEVVVRQLAEKGVKLNVTALMTADQTRQVADWLAGGPPAYISVFAGRIADTGRDPIPIMSDSLQAISESPNIELIWASPREVLNIIQAHEIGCDIITVTHDVLAKLCTLGKDLDEFSLDTVRMFFEDGQAAGYEL